MRVGDILTLLPGCEGVLAQYGLHCVGCHYNAYETLEEGWENHGYDAMELEDLLADLNLLLAERPDRPMTIALTAPAAQALKQVLADDGKAGWGLLVGLDEQGGFCMEAAERAEDGWLTFVEPHHDGLALFATELTLRGIGGATIDYREGRFKLDLPEDLAGCCGGTGDCACKKEGGDPASPQGSAEAGGCACKA